MALLRYTLLNFLWLTGCPKSEPALIVQPTTVKTLRKSPNDTREYDSFVLENGMEVLVVSDPDTDVAAGSLRVRVGSFSDPWERQGLAHFLEHMLLISTEKYPEVDSYRHFVAEHGGRVNASTGGEESAYFFTVDQAHLAPTLDRLSQLFIDPKLEPELVARECMAIESEFRSGVMRDSRRSHEVCRLVANPEHPIAKFSVGTMETLKDTEEASVVDDLWEFYHSEYSASRMSLVVLGREDVASLRKMVSGMFSEVPSNGKPAPVLMFERPEPFLDEHLGVRINVESVGDMQRLRLRFPCPTSEANFKTDPTGVILSLIEAEGNGSLLSLLKGHGWVNTIATQYWLGGDDFKLLTIDFDLTDEGVANHDVVLEHFFQYVRLMSSEDLSRYFEEKKEMAQINFVHGVEESALQTVQMASLLLQYFPTENVVDFSSVYGGFNASLVHTYLSRLNPANMQAVLSAPGVETDLVDPIYGTAYSVVPLGSEKMAWWMESPTDPALSLPEPNDYIATGLTIKPSSGSKNPTLLKTIAGLDVWHLHDSSFNRPHANVRVAVHSSLANNDLHNQVCNRLFVSLLREEIRAFTYPIERAGMSLKILPSWKGLDLEIGGYDEKQLEVLTEVVHRIRGLTLDPVQFDNEKSLLIHSFRSFQDMSPLDQGSQTGFRLLTPTSHEPFASAEALEQVDFEAFQRFVDDWFREISVRLLIHGNHDEAVALELSDVVASTFLKDATPVDWPIRSLRRIPSGELVQDLDIDHLDSSLIVIYQGSDTTVDGLARYKLLGDLIRRDFFTEIRTKQQLGYSVNAFFNQMDHVPGIRMIIQSSSAGPAVLTEKVDAFLVEQKERIASLSDEQFESFKQTIVDGLLKQDEGLSQRTNRLERSLNLGYIDFDEDERLADAIKPLTKDETLRHYDAVFFGEDRGRILIRSTGSAHPNGAPLNPCFGDDCTLPSLVDVIR